MKVVNRDLQRHVTYIVGALHEKDDAKSLFLLTLKEGGVLFALCLFLRVPSPDSGMLMYVTDICSLVSS